jgi:hypothetical protein
VIRVLLPAGEIPLKSTVMKKSGETRYCLTNEIRIDFQVIKAKEGAMFIIPIENSQIVINAISSQSMLLWLADEGALEQWLYQRINGPIK